MSIQVGAVGLVFRALVVDESGFPVDISTATTKQMRFTNPAGTSVDQTAAFHTDGTDGYMYYTTDADDLGSDGEWSVQPYIVMPGATFRTSIHKFDVDANLTAPA